MRYALLVLFLTAATLGFGQTGPASPFSFGQPIQAPLPGVSQDRNFGKAPQWDALRALPQTFIEIVPPKPSVLLGDARIDPKIVRHPSQQNLGTQPLGTELAQNLYPGLRFQPIQEPMIGEPLREPSSGPLSITWPRLKVHEIPTQWPALKMEPVGGALKGEADPSSR
jgi:hypothetical protein